MKNYTTPRTVFEAGQARRDEAAIAIYRANEEKKIADHQCAVMRSDPRIGALCRNGKTIFYAFTRPGAGYVESESVDAVAGEIGGAS